MSNAKILNVLNALTADGGGGNVLKFLNGIMIIRSDAIALTTTFPTPFIDTPTVFISVISTRAVASFDLELYPKTITPTAFSVVRLQVDNSGITTLSGYLAIGRWK
ncbi:hypothetical protein [Sutterella wadsworthensis]|uniref:hypothetical protein n=1 Tax=Sutterella wadsworthensis TaxID=40545 RepID=UPI00242BAE2E|nr:hypothetical protein [Sutterella wadsworthensis]